MEPPKTGSKDRYRGRYLYECRDGGGHIVSSPDMLRRAIELSVPLLAFPAMVLGAIVQADGGRPTPINHVVIIYQENHSFDNVLGILCIQLGRCMGPPTAANGKPVGFLHDGSAITLPNAGDIVSPSPHSHDAQVTAVNGGAMNGFDLMVEGNH